MPHDRQNNIYGAAYEPTQNATRDHAAVQNEIYNHRANPQDLAFMNHQARLYEQDLRDHNRGDKIALGVGVSMVALTAILMAAFPPAGVAAILAGVIAIVVGTSVGALAGKGLYKDNMRIDEAKEIQFKGLERENKLQNSYNDKVTDLLDKDRKNYDLKAITGEELDVYIKVAQAMAMGGANARAAYAEHMINAETMGMGGIQQQMMQQMQQMQAQFQQQMVQMQAQLQQMQQQMGSAYGQHQPQQMSYQETHNVHQQNHYGADPGHDGGYEYDDDNNNNMSVTSYETNDQDPSQQHSQGGGVAGNRRGGVPPSAGDAEAFSPDESRTQPQNHRQPRASTASTGLSADRGPQGSSVPRSNQRPGQSNELNPF